MEEIWKPIKNYPNYEISNKGRVRRLPYVVYYKDGRVRHNKGYIKKLTRKDGYLCVMIFNKQGGKGYLAKVHRLIAEAFIPNPNNKPYIDHINTVRDDNRIENLRWVTPKENNNNSLTIKHQSVSRNNLFKEKPELRKKISELTKKKFVNPSFKESFVQRMTSEEVQRKRWINNPQKKTVYHYDNEGKLLGVYFSTNEAAKAVGVSQSMVSRYCLRKASPKDKTIWKYNESNNIK